MAETNLSGPILGVRRGSAHVRQTIKVTPTEVAQKILTISASATVPVIVEAQLFVITADATETVSIGSNSADYDNLINDASLANADVFLPASNAVGKLVLTANTDIYALASTGTDTGVIYAIFDLATVNTAAP